MNQLLPDSGRKRKARQFDTSLVIRLMQCSTQRHRYTTAHIRALPMNAISCDLDAIAVRSGCLQRKRSMPEGFGVIDARYDQEAESLDGKWVDGCQ